MLGKRELTYDDYVSMLKRRLRVIILLTVVGTLLAYLSTLVLPAKYTSTSKIIVEQPQVPPDMVHPVVVDRLDQRLALMRQQVLSRSRLQPIIDRYGLYKDISSPDVVAAKVIADIDVGLVTTKNNDRTEINGFTVAYTAANPKLAQQVCSDVTSLFIQENLHEREQSLAGTTDFLDRQLQDAKKELDRQDAQLAEFKTKYMGQIPGREDGDMALLMSLNNRLESTREALYRSQQDKSYAESMLAQQLAAYESTNNGDSNPILLQQQMAKMQAQLVTLEARYTSEYPDVIKLKNDIAQVKKQLEQAQLSSSNPSPDKPEKTKGLEPASIQQLRYQIHQNDENIKARTREENTLERQISLYQGRLNVSPRVEQQYKELTRGYKTAQEAYNNLLAKKSQAEMASDLERRQQGEQFRLIDPPNYPNQPSFPNPLLFSLGGLGGGFSLGCALALFLEMKDRSLRTPEEVEFYLEVPVLGVLPNTTHPNGNGHGKLGIRRNDKPKAVEV